MSARFEILNTHKHRHLKVRREGNRTVAAGIDTVDVVLAEFRAAASAFPIVFVQEHPDTPPLPVLLDHE
ncbi:MAG: SapC family protein, partial [Methylococcaceae bacterium]